MISALAFGYGVGMAAPDAAIDDMRVALSSAGGRRWDGAPAQGPYAYGPPHAWAGHGPSAAGRGLPAGYAYPPGYYPPHPGYGPATGYPMASDAPAGLGDSEHARESAELARLRRQNPAGAHCTLHHPNHSEPPRYVSEELDAPPEDVDDLDPAAQEALSRLQLPDFRVPITRRALKYVRFLTRSDRGRGMFETWLKRSGRYQELVQQTLREWHLPEDLIWVAMIESGFDPRAKSPAGAVGLWQFMKSTGSVYGLEVTAHADDRMNPVKATRAAAHHLRDLYQRFGSWDLALAAYNMGYEQLLDRIDRYGTTDFNELARQRALPSETAAYVPKIIAAALVANNLERYGFADVKVFKPLHHAELLVPGGTDLKTVARAAGVTTQAMRTFNPHLRGERVPPGGDYVVFLPAESLSRARAALPAMLDDGQRVSDADVLLPDELAELSPGKRKRLRQREWSEDENLLSLLPKPKRRSLRSVLRGRDAAADDSVAAMTEEFLPPRSDRETVMYRVGPGDTLIGIAKQFVIDIDDLARENDLDPDAKLRDGALLKLSVKRQVLERWKRGGAARRTQERARQDAIPTKGEQPQEG